MVQTILATDDETMAYTVKTQMGISLYGIPSGQFIPTFDPTGRYRLEATVLKLAKSMSIKQLQQFIANGINLTSPPPVS